jgi:hypothetical protein
MIFQKKPQRGATLKRVAPPISQHHVLAVAGLCAAVALAAILTPSGDVSAGREEAAATAPTEIATHEAQDEARLAPIIEAAATLDTLNEPRRVYRHRNGRSSWCAAVTTCR